MYSDRTFSETAAVIMRTGAAIMLIPAAFGLFFSAIGFLTALIGGSAGGVLLSSIPFFTLGVGITLFVGYCQLASRRLESYFERPLWIVTLVLNGIPLVPLLYELTKIPKIQFSSGSLLLVPFVMWWLTAVVLSAISLAKISAAQKYR